MIATNEELALLEKWKRKLYLQEWRIKLLTQPSPGRNDGASYRRLYRVVRSN